MHLSKYLKNCGEFPNKPVNSSGCAAAIELSDNNSSSDQITEQMARDRLKDIFQTPTSKLCEEKGGISGLRSFSRREKRRQKGSK